MKFQPSNRNIHVITTLEVRPYLPNIQKRANKRANFSQTIVHVQPNLHQSRVGAAMTDHQVSKLDRVGKHMIVQELVELVWLSCDNKTLRNRNISANCSSETLK